MIKEELNHQYNKRGYISAAIGQTESVSFSPIWGSVLDLDEGGDNMEGQVSTANKAILSLVNVFTRTSAEVDMDTEMLIKTTSTISVWQGIMDPVQYENLIQEA